jgi:hypothetical protein
LSSLTKKKPGTFVSGFFDADKEFEISDHTLIADMIRIIKRVEVFSK